MAIWNYLLDSDLLQRIDIERLEAGARATQQRVARAQRAHAQRIAELEQQVGELLLAQRALLTMLQVTGRFDAPAFQAALEGLDAADGVVDGRVTPEDARPPAPGPVRPPVAAPVPRRRG